MPPGGRHHDHFHNTASQAKTTHAFSAYRPIDRNPPLLSGSYGLWRNHADGVAKAATATQSAQPAPKVPVTVATVQKTDFPLYLYGLGTVTPLNSVSISSRVAGGVNQVPVEQGQMVKQGDLLAEIDPRPYQAVLDQAKAKEAEDEATLKNAQVVLNRLATLLKKTFETQQDVDNQQAVVTTAAAQTIEGDKAAIEAAQLNLDFTRITAPLTGKTSFRTIDPGNIVTPRSTTGFVSVIQIHPDRSDLLGRRATQKLADHNNFSAGRARSSRRSARRPAPPGSWDSRSPTITSTSRPAQCSSKRGFPNLENPCGRASSSMSA